MDRVEFSSPRLKAEFDDWPLGGNKRGRCVFQVERHPTRGCRVTRTTTGKPKVMTYCTACCVVDGSDGKTYILTYTDMYGAISIWRSDFMTPDAKNLGRPHYVTKTDADHEELLKMIVHTGSMTMPVAT